MSKFNLVNYKKSDPDSHISRQLEDQRSDAPTEITEKQLEKDRVSEKDSILEKQLDSVRTGSAEVIIEKNLSTSKGLFAKLRDETAYDGDLPKLEAKRIKNDKTEDEKYELASETISSKRWWEGLAPKKASSNLINKIARKRKGDEFDEPEEKGEELEFTDPRKSLERTEGIWGEEGEVEAVEQKEKDVVLPPDDTEIPPPISEKAKVMYVAKNNEFHTPVDAIHMKLTFDPDDFRDDAEAIRQAALEKVLEVRPNLEELISIDDFSNPTVGAIDGSIHLRLIGPEYFISQSDNPTFEEIKFDEVDAGGTPTSIGKIKVNTDVLESTDSEIIVRDVLDFIKDKHPELSNINEQSLNLEHLQDGSIEYAVSPEGEGEGMGDQTVPDPEEINVPATTEGDMAAENTEIVEEPEVVEKPAGNAVTPIQEILPDEKPNESLNLSQPEPTASLPIPSGELAKANVVSSTLTFPIFEIKQASEKKKIIVE